jgi:hypothetical protein
VQCSVDPQDTVERVELMAVSPGRLLSHGVFSAVVGPGRDLARTFELQASDPAQVTTDSARAREALLDAVNEVRLQAGVSPVSLAAHETETACQVTNPYFLSGLNDAEHAQNADRIALGLMAGWDVDGGMVRDGSFFSSRGAQDDDMAHWVTWAMERPSGRLALLRPEVQQIAVCPWMYGGHTQGVLWSSYEFFSEGTQPREVTRVYEHIDAARRTAGLNPIQPLTSLEASMKVHAQSLEQGRVDLEEALHAMLQDASEATGARVQGWVIPTTDIHAITFPRDMIERSSLRAVVQVAYWRDRNDAWGQTVVFVVMVTSG